MRGDELAGQRVLAGSAEGSVMRLHQSGGGAFLTDVLTLDKVCNIAQALDIIRVLDLIDEAVSTGLRRRRRG